MPRRIPVLRHVEQRLDEIGLGPLVAELRETRPPGSTWPAAFAGSELDPDAARKRMEKLLARVEELVSSPSDSPAVQGAPNAR